MVKVRQHVQAIHITTKSIYDKLASDYQHVKPFFKSRLLIEAKLWESNKDTQVT